MSNRLTTVERKNFLRATIYLVFLSALDALSTDIGIRNGYIEEANPLMRIAYGKGLPLFYFIKIGFPLGFMFVGTKIEPKRYLLLLTCTALFLYTTVLLLHLFWIVVVLLL